MNDSAGLLFCSGAPLNREEDREFAQIVREWGGKRIVSGGTTAKIIARELGLRVSTIPNPRGVTLPLALSIPTITLASEGIITLGHVRSLLKEFAKPSHRSTTFSKNDTIDRRIAHLLLCHRSITMLIGTRLNEAHLDPTLPVVLERRVDVMREIAGILKSEFRKKIEIIYY